MDFDIVALPGPGFSATVASTLALRMTRRKVLLPMAGGIFVYLSDRVLSNLAAAPGGRRTLTASVEA